MLFSLEKFAPRFFCIRCAGSHSLYLDVKIVVATINDEINLAAIRKQVRLVRYGPDYRFVIDKHLYHRQLVDALANLPIISVGIDAASRDRFLKLSPQYIPANDAP